eukprot:CAMPEP_0178449572 /NCGR_PEP_ID=MMETSP0689_2-20121128/42630_1 /TAXON_ID=160604 /ORGANISM="Amphidinium massartii, Strain CS-259" /LENGTH=149 /DNA_ID=CAMNT_0020074915 /DNA_START=42 /DNA_END=488 /DNA_ORIENTATION=-
MIPAKMATFHPEVVATVLILLFWRVAQAAPELSPVFWLEGQGNGGPDCECKRPTDVCMSVNHTDLCVRPSITFAVMYSIAQSLEEPGVPVEKKEKLRDILNRSNYFEADSPFKKTRAIRHSYSPAYGTEMAAHFLHGIVASVCAVGGDV